MSVISTGGNFKCYHGIDTDDVNEWNEHCSDPQNNHTDSGTTQCIQCKSTVIFEDLPYHPITPTGKNISIRCPDCHDNYLKNYDNNSVKKIDNPEIGIRMSQPHEKDQQQQKEGNELK